MLGPFWEISSHHLAMPSFMWCLSLVWADNMLLTSERRSAIAQTSQRSSSASTLLLCAASTPTFCSRKIHTSMNQLPFRSYPIPLSGGPVWSSHWGGVASSSCFNLQLRNATRGTSKTGPAISKQEPLDGNVQKYACPDLA